MDNKSFLEEVHNYVESSYKEFNKYQELAWNVLTEFNRICENNNIDYSLAFGTLLGAVRDTNQIAWDYDIDVLVPISQREKLLKVLDEKLGDEYYYAYKTNTKRYPACCLRVCKKGFDYNALHVDVFFLIGCPSSTKDQSLLFNQCSKVIKKRALLFFPEYSKANNTIKHRLVVWYKRIQSWIYSENRLNHIEESLMHKYDLSQSENCMVMCDVYKRFYPIEIFSNTVGKEIKGTILPIPSGYEEFLSLTYKNYKEYLPIQNRFEEFYSHLSVIRQRQASNK